ncbi:anaphase-promoting complex subunit 10 [Pyrus ussuriensis x Pyrus communis]|uniref:Anaphase-promoting complex subunit 10 n=1 Tax=Pyrus ussuriensis x Pyrus communis TaxID=2448454 RepID=A0A5N5G3A8_9ROSA|nr:anaphase-promoting complex subunit 10 [Pyrus ussuriensis x Pyrus communis]
MATESSEGEEDAKRTGGNQLLVVDDDLREMGKKSRRAQNVIFHRRWNWFTILHWRAISLSSRIGEPNPFEYVKEFIFILWI